MHTHLCTGDHQGIAHIVAGISHIYQLYALQMTQMLLDCQQGCQHLCGMIFVGQAVPYRYVRVFRQLLYDLLSETAVLDAVKHAA